MTKPIQVPEGAPAHVCADLVGAIDLERSSDDRWLDELQRKIDVGEITQGDADRDIADFPDSARERLFDFCERNCGPGKCAMKGFGVELVSVNPNELSDADREKLDFFRSVDVIRFTGKMSVGISPF